MGDVGDHASLLLLRVLQRIGHAVERDGELGQLVAALDVHALVQGAFPEAAGGHRQALNGAQHVPAQQEGAERDGHGDHAERQHDRCGVDAVLGADGQPQRLGSDDADPGEEHLAQAGAQVLCRIGRQGAGRGGTGAGRGLLGGRVEAAADLLLVAGDRARLARGARAALGDQVRRGNGVRDERQPVVGGHGLRLHARAGQAGGEPDLLPVLLDRLQRDLPFLPCGSRQVELRPGVDREGQLRHRGHRLAGQHCGVDDADRAVLGVEPDAPSGPAGDAGCHLGHALPGAVVAAVPGDLLGDLPHDLLLGGGGCGHRVLGEGEREVGAGSGGEQHDDGHQGEHPDPEGHAPGWGMR
nr:hypothetical protein [Catellatospora paridis]